MLVERVVTLTGEKKEGEAACFNSLSVVCALGMIAKPCFRVARVYSSKIWGLTRVPE